jgi:hypothetical protein
LGFINVTYYWIPQLAKSYQYVLKTNTSEVIFRAEASVPQLEHFLAIHGNISFRVILLNHYFIVEILSHKRTVTKVIALIDEDWFAAIEASYCIKWLLLSVIKRLLKLY